MYLQVFQSFVPGQNVSFHLLRCCATTNCTSMVFYISAAQWLSNGVHDSRPRDHGFEPNRHFVVFLNKTY